MFINCFDVVTQQIWQFNHCQEGNQSSRCSVKPRAGESKRRKAVCVWLLAVKESDQHFWQSQSIYLLQSCCVIRFILLVSGRLFLPGFITNQLLSPLWQTHPGFSCRVEDFLSVAASWGGLRGPEVGFCLAADGVLLKVRRWNSVIAASPAPHLLQTQMRHKKKQHDSEKSSIFYYFLNNFSS